jgi:hypothetical protein
MIAILNFTSNDNNPFYTNYPTTFTKYNEELVRNNYGRPQVQNTSDKFSLSFAAEYTNMKNDRGWVAFDDTGIIFAERNREILQNDFTEYALNNKMTSNLTALYYWSYSKNHEFFTHKTAAI